MPISIAEAINNIISCLKELNVRFKNDVRLESFELSKDEKYYLITLSFLSKDNNVITWAIPYYRIRDFKTFQVNCITGKVLSMSIYYN